jgi:hypothetical protein
MLQAMGADGPMAGLDPVAAAAVTGAEVKKVKRELFEVQCQANANNQRANRHFEDLQRVTRERDELRATLDPVRDWYDGDGERTDVAAMLRDAIEDLQRDRKDALKLDQVKRERDALLAMTRNLDVHPEGYDGPCECRLCCSYADCEGLDFDRDAK